MYLKRGEPSPVEFRTQGSQECQEDEVSEPAMSFGWKKLSPLKMKINQILAILQNPTQLFTKIKITPKSEYLIFFPVTNQNPEIFIVNKTE